MYIMYVWCICSRLHIRALILQNRKNVIWAKKSGRYGKNAWKPMVYVVTPCTRSPGEGKRKKVDKCQLVLYFLILLFVWLLKVLGWWSWPIWEIGLKNPDEGTQSCRRDESGWKLSSILFWLGLLLRGWWWLETWVLDLTVVPRVSRWQRERERERVRVRWWPRTERDILGSRWRWGPRSRRTIIADWYPGTQLTVRWT